MLSFDSSAVDKAKVVLGRDVTWSELRLLPMQVLGGSAETHACHID